MSHKDDLPYHPEHRKDDDTTCPETGVDLKDYSAESIRAHAESLYPEWARGNFSPEAKERKEILLKMAKERDK